MNTLLNIFYHHQILFYIGIGTIGLIIGSFLNVVIYRLPIMLKNKYQQEITEHMPEFSVLDATCQSNKFNLVTPRSYCPICGKIIIWWHNIPIASYFILYGKCAQCKQPISWRYPMIELLTCLATIWVVMHFGIHPKTLPMVTLTWILIAAIFIDAKHQLLPDCITIPLLWLGLLINTNSVFTTPNNAILGAVGGYVFLWGIAQIFKFLRKKEGMGYGDFKLFAAFGAWLGWELLPLTIIIASLAGAIVGIILVLSKKHKLTHPLPFGPYLAITGWLACLYGQKILQWWHTYYP